MYMYEFNHCFSISWHFFGFLFIMSTDAYDESTTSEIVDKNQRQQRSLVSFGCCCLFIVLDNSVELVAIPWLLDIFFSISFDKMWPFLWKILATPMLNDHIPVPDSGPWDKEQAQSSRPWDKGVGRPPGSLPWIRHCMCDVKCLISDVWCQISNIRRQMSDIRNLKTSDIGGLMSDVWYKMSEIKCLMSDIWCQVCDQIFKRVIKPFLRVRQDATSIP